MTILETGQNTLPALSHLALYQSENSGDAPSDVQSHGYPLVMPSHIYYKDNREFVCGWCAAFINIVVTFPINKLMFRQMLDGISTAVAMKQLKKEGFKHLYRGILPPLCQKTLSTSIMFGMYGKYKWRLKQDCPFLNKTGRMVVAASLAGCTEAVLCPLERIQTILQDKKSHGTYKNTLHCSRQLWAYGLTEYYRGLSSILIRNSMSNVLFFGLRKKLKNSFPNQENNWYQNVLADFVCGAALGAFISTVFYPINVIKAHQQTQVGGPFQSLNRVFWDVYEARGRKLRLVFKGAHVNYTRAFVSWGVINASYEILMKILYEEDDSAH